MSTEAAVGNTYRAFALAEDAGSFDQEHPINAGFRDSGIGLVPMLSAVDPDAKYGAFACGSIMAHLSIPFGWHVYDDGRCTLVFDPAGRTQLSFELSVTVDSLAIPAWEDGMWLTARIDCSPEERPRALSLAKLILGSVQWPHGL